MQRHLVCRKRSDSGCGLFNSKRNADAQRVAICRVLAMDPIAMLFDEPTPALDVMVALAQDGTTMMVVTYEMGFARKVADRVEFMDAGAIVEDRPTEEFFGAPNTDRAKDFLSKVLNH